MATIVKRKSKFSVIYRYLDENGNERQKWETFETNAQAKKRKAEIEYQQSTGTFTIPDAKTLQELLEEYVSIYGVNSWSLSTYEAKKGLIANYINPMIGGMLLSAITPRTIDNYYKKLLTVKSVTRSCQKPRTEFVSARNVREIHKILNSSFNQAVKWEILSRNPAANASLPKSEPEKREIWTADVLF